MNGNGLNFPIKTHRLVDWIKKARLNNILQETHLIAKAIHRLEVKGRKMIFHAKEVQKQTKVDILISNKVDVKLKLIRRHKDGHYILVKEIIQQENMLMCLIT